MKKNKILIIVLIVILIVLFTFIYIKYLEKIESLKTSNNDLLGLNQIISMDEKEEKVEKVIQIYKGTERPIAVMIDNHDDARPQVSINKAYVVYEIIVEGGYTRMMPIFKGQDIEQIGPVRSARHYFLDYALENDAIYVHFGHSPQAENDINNLNVDDIEGLYYSSNEFTRVNGKYSPHDVMISTEDIMNIAKDKDYRITSNEKSVFNYTTDEVNLEEGESAKEVYIPFSTSQNVTFKYDKDEKVYVKYANNKKQVDWITDEDITFKNLIITFIENYTLNDSANKGRQGLLNIGEKKGYYITNGKAIKITCTKDSRASKTIYRDLEGNEIKVNDGNTYVGICPLNADVEFTPDENENNNMENNVNNNTNMMI